MTIKEAEKIIQEFGQTHELAASIGLAIPDAFLPHPKEKIKEAFLLAYKFSDEQGRDMIRAVFVFLPSYVAIEDAVKVFRYTNYLTKSENAHKDDANLRDDWQRVTNKINAEIKDYLEMLG